METIVLGWDIGGAHVKAACADETGVVMDVRQVPCALWQGMRHLDAALARLAEALGGDRAVHALTMTGELADLFEDRHEGVRRILDCFTARFGAQVRVLTIEGELICAAQAARRPSAVASANWMASALVAAAASPFPALLVDIGSTTSDIVALRDGAAQPQARDDAGRLDSGELVYAGVVRTPVAVLVDRVPWEGRWTAVSAEVFATSGDAWVLSGALVPQAGEFGAGADGRGWNAADCARRLARMIGRDPQAAVPERWRRLAHYVAGVQEDSLRRAVERRLSAVDVTHLVAAGVGAFLVRRIAARLGLECVDFGTLVPSRAAAAGRVTAHAPAAAVARLAAGPGAR